jgi:nitroreductase
LDLFEAIMERRSVRSYQGRPIPVGDLEKLVKAAHWAPSAGNINPRHFVTVTEPKTVEAIKALSPGMFGGPAAVIVLCSDRAKAEKRASSNGYIYSIMDVSMSAQNLLLAAHALEIGACVVRSFHAKAVGSLLGCPEHVVPELLVALGYPQGNLGQGIRPPLEDLSHNERWRQEGSSHE